MRTRTACGRERLSTSGLKDGDRKSTRLNSSHLVISYAVFCLKKKKKRMSVTFPLRKTLPQLHNSADSDNSLQLGTQRGRTEPLRGPRNGLDATLSALHAAQSR